MGDRTKAASLGLAAGVAGTFVLLGAIGMRPRPPHLAEAAAEWELEEKFWLAKNGVKTSGMPAFGPTHDDRTLWSIAAFFKELPAMTPERYAALGGPDGEAPQGGHAH